MKTFKMRLNKASSPCLFNKDVQTIFELAQQLINVNPDIAHQLTLFWNLYDTAFAILKSNPKITEYSPSGIINDNLTRIKNADLLAEKLVSEVKSTPSTVAFPLAFLLAHVVRAETISYAIWKQLNDVVEKFEKLGLKKYDVELICSVQNTVTKYNKRTKRNELRSDVKAIRDSIAHGHFSFRKNTGGYEIEFDNGEYPFHRLFSKKDFEKFFDSYTLLYKFQLTLLNLIELLPILSTHLCMDS
ncbi:MAG: hypothetical protein NWF02_09305 [Candidatus Bathyarchaeota archaeon]|nr:hypothetical protein [Candidatus Bathyarchaeum sp.]